MRLEKEARPWGGEQPMTMGAIGYDRGMTPWPYVNHYHFHVIDKEWGHLTVKMSGHPPFGVQVMLKGHEWIERRARRQTISAVG
jgi:hypothetical protein